MRGQDPPLSREAREILARRGEGVRVEDHREVEGPDEDPDRVLRRVGGPKAGADHRRIHRGGELEDGPDVRLQEPSARERVDDQVRRGRRDRLERDRRGRDMDDVDPDPIRGKAHERGRPRVRPAPDDEEPPVLALVGVRARDRIVQELPGADELHHLLGESDIDDADPPRGRLRHPLLDVDEGGGDGRPDRRGRLEPARHVHAQDRLPAPVHLPDQGRVRLPDLPVDADPEEGVDDQVRLLEQLLAAGGALDDLHAGPEALEVRAGLTGREVLRGLREEDRDARLVLQGPRRDETVPAIVPGAAHDEDLLALDRELRPGDVRDRAPRGLHEIEDRDAEVFRIAVHHPLLRGGEHGLRI